MKILLVSPLPPPMGGIASWTVNVLSYFENSNQDNELIHYNTAGTNRRITDIGYFKRIYSGIKGLYKYVSEVEKKAKLNNVDLVHITSSASLGLFRDCLSLFLLNRSSLKSCIHFRFGRTSQLAIKNNWEWKLLKLVCSLADKVIVIDTESFKTLKDEGFDNVYYLPNPISTKIEKRFSVNNEITKDGSVLFVGHIIPKKGVYELVQACSQLSEVDDLTLVGPFEDHIKEDLIVIAKNKGDSWLKFTGNKDQDFILDKMSKCSAFVLPSHTEGFPNVILESMAAGAPIISTFVGAIPEMLDVENTSPSGICVEFNDVESLQHEIKNVLNNPNNSIDMGKQAHQRVLDEYSMGKVMNDLINIWNKK